MWMVEEWKKNHENKWKRYYNVKDAKFQQTLKPINVPFFSAFLLWILWKQCKNMESRNFNEKCRSILLTPFFAHTEIFDRFCKSSSINSSFLFLLRSLSFVRCIILWYFLSIFPNLFEYVVYVSFSLSLKLFLSQSQCIGAVVVDFRRFVWKLIRSTGKISSKSAYQNWFSKFYIGLHGDKFR